MFEDFFWQNFTDAFVNGIRAFPNAGPGLLRFYDIYNNVTLVFIILMLAYATYLIIRGVEIHQYRERQLLVKLETGRMKQIKESISGADKRWQAVRNMAASTNQSDWRIAIIEADSMLEEMTLDFGYPGQTLGERLSYMSQIGLPHAQDAWDAHKVRNRIAHDGSKFQLSANLTARTLQQFQAVFHSVGYIS